MHRILHKVTIEVPSKDVYKTVTDVKELKNWFSKNTSIEGKGIGSKIKMGFGPGYHIMEVIELVEGKKVVWKVIESKGPNDEMDEEMKAWDDTLITFNLEEKKLERLKGKTVTVLHFKHEDLPREDAYFADCNYHWAYFLTSLKNVAEGKKGTAM